MQQQKVSDEISAHEKKISTAQMLTVVTGFFLGLLIFFCFLVKDDPLWLVVAIVFTVIVGLAFLASCYKWWAARKLKLAAVAEQTRANNEGGGPYRTIGLAA